jgi:HEAT repeat protein
VGPNAIEPLMDALWVALAGNPNFNKNTVDVLVDFRERAVGPAISELIEGPRGGVTWRARRYFVELLGRLRDPRAIRAIKEEIEKTDISEYARDEHDQPIYEGGEMVVDKKRTEQAVFVFHEYCIEALGAIGRPEGLEPIVHLWEKDPDHIDGAQSAIREITGKRVDNVHEARKLVPKEK